MTGIGTISRKQQFAYPAVGYFRPACKGFAVSVGMNKTPLALVAGFCMRVSFTESPDSDLYVVVLFAYDRLTRLA